MSTPSLGEPGSAAAQRRIAESLGKLTARKQGRSFTVSADFGSTPTTTASAAITGLDWLTADQQIVFGLKTLSQLSVDLRACAIDIKPGSGFRVQMQTATNITGVQTLSCIVL